MTNTHPGMEPEPPPAGPSDRSALNFARCTFQFVAPDGGSLPVLNGLDLTVARGEFVAVVGPSGCGKSTALRLATGVLRPNMGRVTVLGGSPDRARSARQIAVAFQDSALLPWRTVRQNVALPLEVAGAHPTERREIVADAILQVGLAGFEEARPDQLSGGMKQRVAIARALTTSPQLLLMDEPFSAVDELTRDRLNLALLDIWSKGDLAVVFVTHSIEEAVFLADRVVVLTRRPASVSKSIATGLPRPRTLAMKRDGAMFEVVAQVRAALEDATR